MLLFKPVRTETDTIANSSDNLSLAMHLQRQIQRPQSSNEKSRAATQVSS